MQSIQTPGGPVGAIQEKRQSGNKQQDQPTGKVIPRGAGIEGIPVDNRHVQHARLDTSVARTKSPEDQPRLEFVLQDFHGDAFGAVRRFENLKEEMKDLGEGKYGQVFECKNEKQHTLAVKHNFRINEGELTADPGRGELLLLALPVHPNIMTIQSVLLRDKEIDTSYGLINRSTPLPADLSRFYVSCVVSEKVEGVSLEDFIRRPACDEKEIVKMFLQLARAVEFMHSHCCTHRDISTTNVMYDPEKGLKLIDFGTVKRGLQRTGSYVGAFQLVKADCESLNENNEGGYDPAALDLWEMGAAMFYCLTGRHISNFSGLTGTFDFPARERKDWKFCANMFSDKPDPDKKEIISSHLKPGLEGMGQECLDIVIKLLRSDPSQRPSARQVVERLAAL